MKQSNGIKICGLILSAGFSGRMGKFKTLLTYQGKSFIQNIVLKLNSVCDNIIIVTGYKASEVEENVRQLNPYPKINFVWNSEFEKGMFSSLQAGLKAVEKCDWVLYHFVDQPGLPQNFYTDFTKQIDSKFNWIQPAAYNQKGHPILIHKSLFDLIANTPARNSLREISKNPGVKKKFWKCEFKGILQDIDTRDDLNYLQ